MKTMLLSIIIPYYNGEKWISTCLDSLLNQDLQKDEYEIIVVDDGSTHSLEVLNGYVNNHQNIKYVRQENAHHSAARNRGLRIAKGEYVFFCDCDDFIATNVLGRIISIASREHADCIIYNRIAQKENESAVRPIQHWDDVRTYATGLEFLNTPPHQFMGPWQFFVRRDLMERHRFQFDEKMWMREDLQFFLELMSIAQRVTIVDAEVYYYVQHTESFVHLSGKKVHHVKFVNDVIGFIEFEKRFIEEHGEKGQLTDGLEKRIWDSIFMDAFLSMHNSFRYASMKRNKEVVARLQDLRLLPLKMKSKKYNLIILLMNRPSLWLFLCRCFHILPQSIRYRYF